MTDLDKLMSIFDNQKEKGILSGDWDRAEYYIAEDSDGYKLYVDVDKVGFCFTKSGRFKGIFNWAG